MKQHRAHLPLLTCALGCALLVSAVAAPKLATPPPAPKAAPELDPWISLCSLRPAPEIQSQLLSRSADVDVGTWHTLKIELGHGPLLLDHSAIVITKMPVLDGKAMDSHALLDYVRHHLNELLPAQMAKLRMVTDADKTKWDSDSPAGAIGALQIANTTNTAFVMADSNPDNFSIFSIHAGSKEFNDLALIWQRRFAVRDATPFEGCILSTQAVGRAIADGARTEQIQPALFTPEWNGVLSAVAEFVQKNGGAVEPALLSPGIGQASWEGVHAKFHHPTVPWLDLEGAWTSTDPEHRFRIEVESGTGKCIFIERNRHGQELRMTVPVKTEHEANGAIRFTIERPNDTKEILNFYNFPSAVTDEILARGPKPSLLHLTRSGSKLIGQWSGLSISKDVSGKHLKELKQPEEAKPRMYPFTTDSPDSDLEKTSHKGKAGTPAPAAAHPAAGSTEIRRAQPEQ